MIVQFLIYAFGIPATLILFNLIAFSVSKKLVRPIAVGFEEITQDWLTFFEDGIPVPADYRQIEQPFIDGAILVRPIPQKQSILPSFRQPSAQMA